MRVYHEKKTHRVRGDHEKKSDGVSIHHKKERWGEFSIRKSDEMRVHHEKERWGESSPYEKGMALEFTMTKRAMGMRVNHEKKSDGVTLA